VESSILWYDLETFGINPAWDKVAQFAALRTNDRFEPIGDPIVLYCKITPDYIPDPKACLVTGITPQETLEKGMSEYEFIQAIDREFSKPGTCVTGYNSIRFDDEFIRNLYYRNFMDPYNREWANGNSRWDIIDLVRVTHDLRPEGINWPKGEWGRTTFRLEKLTEANGIGHSKAHDALSDVYATVEMARLIHDKQPRLFNWVFHHRKKDQLRPLINLEEMTPILHTSSMFSSDHGATRIVAPLTVDAQNRNCIYVYDLSQDPRELIELSTEELKQRMFTPRHENSPPRIPLKGLHVNKAPVIAPLSTLDGQAEQRLHLDRSLVNRNWEELRRHPEVLQKVRQVFQRDEESTQKQEDPDFQIYSGGFFRDQDKHFFQTVHQSSPEELLEMKPDSMDPRIPEMLRRFIGRNFPALLEGERKNRWKSFCAGRLLFPPAKGCSDFGELKKRLENYRQSTELDARQKVIIRALSDYAALLERKVLQ